jgi:hypothetical protein
MSGYRHRLAAGSVVLKRPPVLALGLLCVVLPAYAQGIGIVALAFTPFSAGFVGGVVTGVFDPNSRWYKFGPVVWFACWVLLYTAVFATLSDHPLDAIPNALGISVFWGVIPFAITFSIGRFVTAKLRAYIASHGRR